MTTNINFLGSGQQVDELRERISNLIENSLATKAPIGIKTPLEFGNMSEDSLFKMNTDVLSQISNNYKKKYFPPKKFVEYLRKKFSPYCSVATWYLWRSIDDEPIQY